MLYLSAKATLAHKILLVTEFRKKAFLSSLSQIYVISSEMKRYRQECPMIKVCSFPQPIQVC